MQPYFFNFAVKYYSELNYSAHTILTWTTFQLACHMGLLLTGAMGWAGWNEPLRTIHGFYSTRNSLRLQLSPETLLLREHNKMNPSIMSFYKLLKLTTYRIVFVPNEENTLIAVAVLSYKCFYENNWCSTLKGHYL